MARPVGREQEEIAQAEREWQEARQAEEAQREEKDLVGKVAEVIDEVGDKLTDRQIMRFEASAEIERPVEEVLDYVTDPENLPEWASPVVEVRDVQKATPDRLRQSDKFTVVAKFLGLRFETSCEVTDYLSNRQFSFRSTSGPVPQEFTYTFEPTLERTHLTQSVEAEPGTFFKLAGSSSKRRAGAR